MFETGTYIERRKGLRERVGSGLILLLGNDPAPMNYPDNPYHFKQDSSFLYYFGLELSQEQSRQPLRDKCTAIGKFDRDRGLRAQQCGPELARPPNQCDRRRPPLVKHQSRLLS